MTIDQSDYLGGESQLVPEGLRLYRHYRIDVGGFRSTTITQAMFEPGVNQAKCHAPEYSRASRTCPRCCGTGIMRYHVPRPSYNFFADEVLLFPPYEVEQRLCNCCRNRCNAPNVECQCGFYASYSPDTDYFAQFMTPAWHNIRADIPTAFAVVEASGHVLMGSKGVRAERMRIVAAAIDVPHAIRNGSGPEYSLHALRHLQFRYGIETFGDDIASMVRAYPQPDLSHLIKNQEK